MNTRPAPPSNAAPPEPSLGAGTPTGQAEGALTQHHYDAMRDAKTKRAKIDFAIGVATFNGWSIGIFAALSALFLPFSFGLQSLLITLGLAAVAYHEFKGRRLLRNLDLSAPRLLGFNQIAFGAVIIGYCAWTLTTELLGPGTYAQTIEKHPELADTLGSVEGLIQLIVVLVYGSIILLTIPYQAAMAWYYFSRAPHMKRFLNETPDWVADMQRAAA